MEALMRPMLRLYLRLTICFLVPVSVLLIIIRTQPYDDRAVRQLLQTDGCTAPCFLGIRPGITTASDAIALLRDSQWVQPETIAYTESDYGGGAVWLWNKQASPLLSSHESSLVTTRRNGVQIVDLVHITTLVASGDAYLTLGSSSYTATGDTGLRGEVYMAWFYPNQGISLWSDVLCPARSDHIWVSPIVVQFRVTMRRSDRTHMPGTGC
jgi:hypothetical protein